MRSTRYSGRSVDRVAVALSVILVVAAVWLTAIVHGFLAVAGAGARDQLLFLAFGVFVIGVPVWILISNVRALGRPVAGNESAEFQNGR